MFKIKRTAIGLTALFTFFSLIRYEQFLVKAFELENTILDRGLMLLIYAWKIILLLFLIYNVRKVFAYQKNIYIWIVIYIVMGIISIGKNPDLFPIVGEMWGFYITDVIPIVITILFIGDASKVLELLIKIAYANLPYIVLFPFTNVANETGAYMSYGYGTAVWWGCILLKEKKTMFDIFYLILSALFLFLFGNRGVIVCLLSIIVLYIVFFTNLKRKLMYVLLISGAISLVVGYGMQILSYLEKIVPQLGAYSRTLERIFSGTYDFSYGRNILYTYIIEKIKENPSGYGLGYDRLASEYISGRMSYAHNLFFELWLDFGWILGTILSLIILAFGFIVLQNRKYKENYRKIICLFWGIGVAQLMLSSSIFISTTVLTAATLAALSMDGFKYEKSNE